MHATTGVGRARGEVEAAEPGAGPPFPGPGPQHQHLVQLRGPAVDGPADQGGVARLQLVRPEHAPCQHPVAEPRRQRLDPRLDPVPEALGLRRVPASREAVGTRVPADPVRHVGVGPQRLGARGGAGGVGGGHLAGEEVRRGRHPPGGHLARGLVHLLGGVPDVEAAGCDGRRCLPRDRTRQRPVDLDRRRVELEVAQPAAYPRRVVLLVHERAPQHRDADGAEHGVPGPDLPPRRAYADGPAVPHDHALHRGAGAQLAAQRHEPARHGRGQLAGSPHRHGEPVGLREHGHDEAERPRTGRVQRDVGVPRAPADQQPRVVPGEAAPARPEGGRQELADRAQGAVARQRQTGPGSGWPSGAGGVVHRSPWDPRSSRSTTGEAAAKG